MTALQRGQLPALQVCSTCAGMHPTRNTGCQPPKAGTVPAGNDWRQTKLSSSTNVCFGACRICCRLCFNACMYARHLFVWLPFHTCMDQWYVRVRGTCSIHRASPCLYRYVDCEHTNCCTHAAPTQEATAAATTTEHSGRTQKSYGHACICTNNRVANLPLTKPKQTLDTHRPTPKPCCTSEPAPAHCHIAAQQIQISTPWLTQLHNAGG